jgi:hypothetical protein
VSPFLTLERRLERPLSLRSDTSKVPSLAVLPVNESTMLSDSVVPDDDSLVLPLDASLEIGALCQMGVQEVENGVGFLLFQSDNITSD